MTWILIIGGSFLAWATLSLMGAEHVRLVAQAEHDRAAAPPAEARK